MWKRAQPIETPRKRDEGATGDAGETISGSELQRANEALAGGRTRGVLTSNYCSDMIASNSARGLRAGRPVTSTRAAWIVPPKPNGATYPSPIAGPVS